LMVYYPEAFRNLALEGIAVSTHIMGKNIRI
jgi:hypothetical protein